MAKIKFGGTMEEVVTREEFPMEKALQVLAQETIAIIGYGVQGPAQSLNLRDNGFNVIVGQRKGGKSGDSQDEEDTLTRRITREKGFTLIELIVSTAITITVTAAVHVRR